MLLGQLGGEWDSADLCRGSLGSRWSCGFVASARNFIDKVAASRLFGQLIQNAGRKGGDGRDPGDIGRSRAAARGHPLRIPPGQVFRGGPTSSRKSCGITPQRECTDDNDHQQQGEGMKKIVMATAIAFLMTAPAFAGPKDQGKSR